MHKRKIGNCNDTLCEEEGAKIFLSDRVTCAMCRMIEGYQGQAEFDRALAEAYLPAALESLPPE